jgi:PKD repeat protein
MNPILRWFTTLTSTTASVGTKLRQTGILLAITALSVGIAVSLFADPACTLPGVTVVEDSTGDSSDMQSNHDIVNCSVAYPFTSTSSPDLLTFTIKASSLTTPLTPQSFYYASFTVDGAPPTTAGSVHGVRMDVDQTGAATFKSYVATADNNGVYDGRFVASSQPAEAGSNFNADGTITIIVRPSRVGVPATGTHTLTNWNGGVAVFIGVNGAGGTSSFDSMPATAPDTRGGDPFTVLSNQTCNTSPTPTPTPTATPTPGARCAAPYIKVQDGAAVTGSVPDPTNQYAIERVNMGEPFVNCSSKALTIVLKVPTMDPSGSGQASAPPAGVWEVRFTVPGSANSTGQDQEVFVSYDTTNGPGYFTFGWLDGTSDCQSLDCALPPSVDDFCWVSGTLAPDGTLTWTFDLDLMGAVEFPSCRGTMTINPSQWIPGIQLTNIQGVTKQHYTPGLNTGTDTIMAQTVGDGTYTVEGNLSCSNPPVAALSATPTSGNAPLTVNFDASGSNMPSGSCGTIASYNFTFGDGQQVTQSTPTVSHTYNTGGATYPARVRVTSTKGVTSSNIAEQDITVNPSGPPIVTSVVSRKTHTGVGDFDVVLPQPPALRSVECRSGGTNKDFQLVFTFLNNITSIVTTTVTGGAGAVTGSTVGPNSNQWTVFLTGVTNAQSTTVTLGNALDATGALGDVSAIIGVLLGDVNASARADAGDVTAVRNRTVSIPDATTFRYDVNTTGRIDSGDVTATRNATVTILP